MSPKHVVFVVNPRSGTERQKEVAAAIAAVLDKQRFTSEIVHTQHAHHGTTLARDAAAKGAYAVVAVGGDGSVNDVVQGLLGTDTLLAIIPKGSGNGMARTMNIPLDTQKAIAVINKGNAIKLDIGFANDRPFMSNAGVAFDALISKKFARSERRGLAVYSWLVTKYMWMYKEWDWQVTVDGKDYSERAFIINVANGKQFGYNFQIAPMASYTDGILDIIIIRKFPKLLGGALVARAMTGTIASSPYVQHIQGREITISHPNLKLMQTDGDAHDCDNKIHFRVDKGAVGVLVP